jgi:protein involved in polysaccharide export with SLBB domain
MEFSDGMTLNDLIFYAGGLKQEAANNKIEVSRVSLINEENGESSPTKIVVLTAEIGPNLELDPATKAFVLNPMDQVFVRKTFEYDIQQNITINGEVKYPGIYPILQKDEKILDLILRAGGFTKFAAPEEATLYRNNAKIGTVILDLKSALEDPNSTANYILKEGDIFTIPTTDQLVKIMGAIRYPDLDTLETVAGRYVPGKKAKWYIKEYGVGFAKRAKRKSTVSLFPNGSGDYTKFRFLYREFPKVKPGSVINVEFKEAKVKLEKEPRKRLDWNIVLPIIISSVASAVSTTVLYITLRR